MAYRRLTRVIIMTFFIQNVTVCKLSQASCLLLQDENASFLVVLMMMIILDDFCWAQKKCCRFYSPALSPHVVVLKSPLFGFIPAKCKYFFAENKPCMISLRCCCTCVGSPKVFFKKALNYLRHLN